MIEPTPSPGQIEDREALLADTPEDLDPALDAEIRDDLGTRRTDLSQVLKDPSPGPSLSYLAVKSMVVPQKVLNAYFEADDDYNEPYSDSEIEEFLLEADDIWTAWAADPSDPAREDLPEVTTHIEVRYT